MNAAAARPVVRPARLDDLDAIQALARRTIDASYREFLGDDNVDAFLGSGASDAHLERHLRRGGVACLDADGEVVGVAILEGSTLDLLMIDVGHHRQGLGRVLLAWVEERLFSRFTAIRCETFDGNASANAFYEACGWTASARTETDDGLPARIEFVKARAARARPDGGAGRPTLNR